MGESKNKNTPDPRTKNTNADTTDDTQHTIEQRQMIAFKDSKFLFSRVRGNASGLPVNDKQSTNTKHQYIRDIFCCLIVEMSPNVSMKQTYGEKYTF